MMNIYMREKNPENSNVNVNNRGKQHEKKRVRLRVRRVKIKGSAIIGWTYSILSKMMHFLGI